MSNFTFLSEWSEIQLNAQQAEKMLNSDPRTCCFYSRYTLERAVHWMYEFDRGLLKPKYDTSLNTLINQPDFRDLIGSSVFPKIKAIQKSGNNAVHSSAKVNAAVATQTLKELHHVLYWLYRTYTAHKPATNQVFDLNDIPQTVQVDAGLITRSAQKLKELQKQLEERDAQQECEEQNRERENVSLRQELEQLKARVAERKQQNVEVKDSHNYNEAETRHFIIDQYLKEMGWLLTDSRDREYSVSGMPISSHNPMGNGFVDYVLWGDDGKPLAVVEAKRTTADVQQGKRQAELYADCLQQDPRFGGRRPLIYFTNGYEIFFWDDLSYTPRKVQGFLSKDEMQRLIDRRDLAQALNSIEIDTHIAGFKRPYQQQAIRAVCEQFDQQRRRKALLVMATGTGKTRTIIGLVDILMRAGWVKNVLFLADRNALVTQAKKEFSKLLPKCSPEILSGATTTLKGRLYLSTYPTMMNLLSDPPDSRLFGVGHFDLVIVDEAHRSVYKKYGYIFDYFDSLLIGLTATPKADLDKNTYDVFQLPNNDPTFAYELQEAIDDGYLVPPRDVRVGLGFVREGIKYSDLSKEEQEEWESNEELQDRDEVLPSEINEFLFNESTVVEALKVLMERGIKVAGGDRLAKTIVFAANNLHAQFINKVFDNHFPKYKGKFARTITYKAKYAESLIEEFKGERQPADPNIPMTLAISVDMLDTGIDVPEVANLMFFKVVKSKVKFLQMLGRGTRLCANLFGPISPDNDKTEFKVFDICQNFEYFEMNPQGAADSASKSLSQALFENRLLLAQTLKERDLGGEYGVELRQYLLKMLHHRVAGMNLDNFIVRPNRKLVEKYQKEEIWQSLTDEHLGELVSQISRLPCEAEPIASDEQEDELALRFDQLILTIQLSLLERRGISDNQQDRLLQIAQQLKSRASIPPVEAQIDWIEYVLSKNFWQDMTLEDLEITRRRLRLLLRFIDKERSAAVFTNFQDEVVTLQENEAPYSFGYSDALTLYRKRVESWVREHQHDLTIQRLRRGQQITKLDLEQLDNKLFEASGIADIETYQQTIHPDKPLGVFIRELVGLDRNAAKAAFADYLDETRFDSQQIQFVNTIIDWLTENGTMNPERLAQPPFTEKHFEGVFGFFDMPMIIELRDRIIRIEQSAVGE